MNRSSAEMGYRSSTGKHRVERISKERAESVAPPMRAGREFQNAVREVLTTNAELLILARKQKPSTHEPAFDSAASSCMRRGS